MKTSEEKQQKKRPTCDVEIIYKCLSGRAEVLEIFIQ